MKVLVFQRENGQHLAVPVAHALLGVIAILACIVLSVAGHVLQGFVALGAIWLITMWHFHTHKQELVTSAMNEYARKYGGLHDEYEGEYEDEYEGDDDEEFIAASQRASDDELEQEMLADGEVTEATDVPVEREIYEQFIPVLTEEVLHPTPAMYQEGYEDGYRDGRKRLDTLPFESDEDEMSDYDYGYRAGYGDGRGHKARQYFD